MGSLNFEIVNKNTIDIDEPIEYFVGEWSTPCGSARIVYTLSNDLAAFLSALKGLKDAGGGDYPEEVFVGLKTAMSAGLGWTENSSKHIFLFGDDPAKGIGETLPFIDREIMEGVSGLNRERIIELASGMTQYPESRTHIHTILGHVARPATRANNEMYVALAREQFEWLARHGGGNPHFNDGRGLFEELNTSDPASRQRVVDKLTTHLSRDFGNIANIGEISRDPTRINPADSPGAASIYDIVNSRIAVYPGFEGRAKTHNDGGWQVADLKIMVTRSQMEAFAGRVDGMLGVLKQFGRSNRRHEDVKRAIDDLHRTFGSTTTGSIHVLNRDLDLTRIIQEEFPVKVRFDGVLSLFSMRGMSSTEFDDLLRQVEGLSAWAHARTAATESSLQAVEDYGNWEPLIHPETGETYEYFRFIPRDRLDRIRQN